MLVALISMSTFLPPSTPWMLVLVKLSAFLDHACCHKTPFLLDHSRQSPAVAVREALTCQMLASAARRRGKFLPGAVALDIYKQVR